MRITDLGVYTGIAQIALNDEQDGLTTEIVAFFDKGAAAAAADHESDLADRARQRSRDRLDAAPPILKK